MREQMPRRSAEQRLRALERANEIRLRRARLKRDLKAGRAQLAEILRDPPEYVLTATVFDLLLSVPKLGPVKAARLLRESTISRSQTVVGLSDRERSMLVGLLRRSSRP